MADDVNGNHMWRVDTAKPLVPKGARAADTASCRRVASHGALGAAAKTEETAGWRLIYAAYFLHAPQMGHLVIGPRFNPQSWPRAGARHSLMGET